MKGLRDAGAFANDVRSLVSTLEEMGNPFEDDSNDLISLESKETLPSSVRETVMHIKKIGKTQYQTFIEERLEKQEKAIDDVISQNKLPLFNSPKQVDNSKVKGMVAELKNDCHLFSRLYIASQRRERDLDNFFCHENQAFPPAITNNGKMRKGA
ncbi:hypothetical protein GWK47_030372 [Chionoecetes opilio]|uniref:Uncharacterized protein n=1 Tax=Chionoecetes opilio TaxID=41210 RepID=A0A8J5D1M0_CHIOP|nr:hypothetical protein GWK47_030372 [Chionoecetes opilio]